MAVGDPIPAERRMDGMYGEAYRDGRFLADVIEVSGTINIDRRELPIAGSVNTHYKRGRVSREGTLRYQAVDSRWLQEFLNFTSLSLEERRAARDAGTSVTDPFDLQLTIDDPEAFGHETLMLYGVVMWSHNVGFSISDLLEREIPITWVREELINPVVQPNV
jgi:hypothetical protein